MKQRGFTPIDLITVIVIILLLMAIVASFSDGLDGAQRSVESATQEERR